MAKSITKTYDDLPWIVRLLLHIFLGYLISGIYRIVKFVEKKNIVTLIVGLLALFTGVGNLIFWVIDLITVIFGKGYSVCAD